MRRFTLPVLCFALLCAVATPAFAWGRTGHRLVAALAWDDLSPNARTAVAGLLAEPEDPSTGSDHRDPQPPARGTRAGAEVRGAFRRRRAPAAACGIRARQGRQRFPGEPRRTRQQP